MDSTWMGGETGPPVNNPGANKKLTKQEAEKNTKTFVLDIKEDIVRPDRCLKAK